MGKSKQPGATPWVQSIEGVRPEWAKALLPHSNAFAHSGRFCELLAYPGRCPGLTARCPVRGVAIRCRHFYRISDAHIRWCRIANPTQLKRCPYGQECLSRSELSWICNPAPLNIRICNPKYTVLTFFPHHRCSYSMVADCKSATTKHSLSRRELSRIAHRPMVACRKQEILYYFSSSRYCSMSMPRFLSVRSLLSHISR